MPDTVLIVDSAAAFRRGLGMSLRNAGFDVEEAGSVSGWAGTPPVQAVVVTVDSPTGLVAALEALPAAPRPVVVGLVGDSSPGLVADALRLGVSGVVERDAPPELIVDAVRMGLSGHTVIPTWAAGAFAPRLPGRPPTGQWVQDDEAEWLRLLADGVTVASLASQVGYSEREMFRNLHELYTRIGVKNRTGALLWAERHGLLEESGSQEA